MEPNEIDNIIRNKLQESSDLHRPEMDSAKPFVWSAVHNQIVGKQSLTWYHLAAALALLLIGFSFVLYQIQTGHRNQIDLLSNKVDQLQQNYSSQVNLLQTKETQVESMGKELRNIELQLTDLQQQESIVKKETIVFRTDTVFIKQVEYINNTPDPMEMKVVSTSTIQDPDEQEEIVTAQESSRDDAIFSNYSYPGNRQQSETIKFKFGSFTERKN